MESITSANDDFSSFVTALAERILNRGLVRRAETMRIALRSFQRFLGDRRPSIAEINTSLIEAYETHLRQRGVTRNTSSFYMRNLRSAYRTAIEEAHIPDAQPFSTVYTGIDKTTKRAVTIDEIRRIGAMDLSKKRNLAIARDLYLFSFYTRGMPFVDMAYLLKNDLSGGYLTYRRHKTGQLLVIEWTPEMQAIVDRYPTSTPYLLPIITQEGPTPRLQYLNALSRVNRNLKILGNRLGLTITLTSYTSRHGWATIARNLNVPLSVISKGLGHDNEKTTQIYLDTISSSVVDQANRMILSSLNSLNLS
ncbi:MAG: site-specific integrase [Bacteroidales bacterium]|nr:site-specific integrase [Bacteroidales bacterium]MCD8394041.1 site-specific integrase [Bacteroidales bacterium]